MIKKSTYLEFFPYPTFRLEQENIIEKIELFAREGKNIILVAPNGTGKTIIALSAIIPVAIDKKLKVIYLCRTHAQSDRVIRELQMINKFFPENSRHVSGVSLRGRKEMCLNNALKSFKISPTEAMLICKDLRSNNNCSYYRNIKEILKGSKPLDFYSFERPIDAQELISISKNRNYCPYFLAKYLLKKSPIIVCNFQWIFNPDIRYRFFKFLETSLDKCILIVDECHNIVNIATEVNSGKLVPNFLTVCLNELRSYRLPQKYMHFVSYIKSILTQKRKDFGIGDFDVNPEELLCQIYKKLKLKNKSEFNSFLDKMITDSQAIVQNQAEKKEKEPSKDNIKAFVKFWKNWVKKYTSERYYFCYSVKKSGNRKFISLEIVALDPRDITVPIFKKSYASLNMTGTVNPTVFNHLTGLSYKDHGFEKLVANSPFQSKNIMALIIEGVDTTYNNRNSFMYKKIINRIVEIISYTPANIGIFCASYKILNDLIMAGIKISIEKTGKKVYSEDRGKNASQNAEMLKHFKISSRPPHKGAVLLGVCGGRNSEGEDYPGDFMNAVIIVGIPYHFQSPRVKAKIEYYNKVFNRQGWVFAYLYPAMQRANQASGRPIRKESDKGVIVFMDSRFKDRIGWISDWVKKEIQIIPANKSLRNQLSIFWNS